MIWVLWFFIYKKCKTNRTNAVSAEQIELVKRRNYKLNGDFPRF